MEVKRASFNCNLMQFGECNINSEDMAIGWTLYSSIFINYSYRCSWNMWDVPNFLVFHAKCGVIYVINNSPQSH